MRKCHDIVTSTTRKRIIHESAKVPKPSSKLDESGFPDGDSSSMHMTLDAGDAARGVKALLVVR